MSHFQGAVAPGSKGVRIWTIELKFNERHIVDLQEILKSAKEV